MWDPTTRNIFTEEPRLMFTRQNFNYRASNDWNKLHDSIKTNTNIGCFKRQVKAWMKDQRPKPPD